MKRLSSLNLLRRPPTAERDNPASTATAAQKIASNVQAALSSLERASSTLQKRKRAAALAAILNGVEGESAVLVVEVLRRFNAARRLLSLLDEAMDEADDDDDDDSQDMNEADLLLAASLLSCLGSLTFLGAVQEFQAAGGVLQLLKLMAYAEDDGTIRSYAAAALQNATSFLELFDAAELSEVELHELRELSASADEQVSGPAKHVSHNIEQARHFRAGELDLKSLTRRLDKVHKRDSVSFSFRSGDGSSKKRGGGGPPPLLTAESTSRWWEHAKTVDELAEESDPRPVHRPLSWVTLHVTLTMGETGGFGVRLASDAPKPKAAVAGLLASKFAGKLRRKVAPRRRRRGGGGGGGGGGGAGRERRGRGRRRRGGGGGRGRRRRRRRRGVGRRAGARRGDGRDVGARGGGGGAC